MEIYTINVDGTGLAQLTNDGFINAHPAWSPDDSLICWSPLTPGLNEFAGRGRTASNRTGFPEGTSTFPERGIF